MTSSVFSASPEPELWSSAVIVLVIHVLFILMYVPQYVLSLTNLGPAVFSPNVRSHMGIECLKGLVEGLLVDFEYLTSRPTIKKQFVLSFSLQKIVFDCWLFELLLITSFHSRSARKAQHDHKTSILKLYAYSLYCMVWEIDLLG